MREQALSLKSQLLPQSSLAKGINYLINEYPADVLRRLPSMNITEIEELLPEHWKPCSGTSAQPSAPLQASSA